MLLFAVINFFWVITSFYTGGANLVPANSGGWLLPYLWEWTLHIYLVMQRSSHILRFALKLHIWFPVNIRHFPGQHREEFSLCGCCGTLFPETLGILRNHLKGPRRGRRVWGRSFSSLTVSTTADTLHPFYPLMCFGRKVRCFTLQDDSTLQGLGRGRAIPFKRYRVRGVQVKTVGAENASKRSHYEEKCPAEERVKSLSTKEFLAHIHS